MIKTFLSVILQYMQAQYNGSACSDRLLYVQYAACLLLTGRSTGTVVYCTKLVSESP